MGINLHKRDKIHHISVVGTISELSSIIEKFQKKDQSIDMLIVADRTFERKSSRNLS